MTTRDEADKRTVQDDRAELLADPHQGSPLAEGEGAPLAEDGVDSATPETTTTQLLLGGAPVSISMPGDPGSSNPPVR